jgi:hypothetical protein
VIESETSEWGKFAITDFTSVDMNSQCPSEYEKLTGYFPGLQTICRRGGSYDTGSCPRRSTGMT